jgi:alpha-L-fucosidase 2
MKRLALTVAVAALTASTALANRPFADQLPMKLWYNQPATIFEEALAIGNGKLGAMVYGGPDDNLLQFNDITFWSGRPVNLNMDSTAYRWIPKIREALFNEDYRLADSLQHRVQGPNSQYYQPLSSLHIVDLNDGEVSDYRRELSLDSAVCSDRYVRNGVAYSRTYFASHPDKVIAIRLEASRPGTLYCNLYMQSLVNHGVKASDKQLTMTGNAEGDPNETIHFCSVLRVKNDGGTVEKTDTSLVISGANSAVVYFVNETSFNGAMHHPVREGAPYIDNAMDDAWHLVNFTYDSLLQRHVEDYQTIYGRVKMHLDGTRQNTDITTDSLLHAYGKDAALDKYLETLYFQFGRYLLIACSRTPNVPANLQGLWNNKRHAPWRGNYTININLEENYWPCDVTNMPELFTPLSSFTQQLAITGAYNAKHYYGIDQGWSCGHNSDIWAMSNPVGEKRESPQWSNWNLGGAWLMQNLYDHYLYTQDMDYLRRVAYPLMKGSCQFMLRWLVPDPKNPKELITAPCTSPENEYKTFDGYHGTTCYGGSGDLAILRDLFANTIEASKLLGTDKALRDSVADALSRLRPYTIGHQGDLNEWYYDWDDWDPKHRHQMHLYGLYPGNHISPEATPKLAQAATRTLELKGDISTGWSTGWRICLWSRLRRRDKAYQIYRNLLAFADPKHFVMHHGGTYPNLFDAHPPFQIDGNFGGVAGVCEMLMQSGKGKIELLPCTPEAWSSGSVQGLVARGGVVLSFDWKDGKVGHVEMTGRTNGRYTLIYNGKQRQVKIKKGKTIRL